MSDADNELPKSPPSVLEDPIMHQLVKDLGILPEDYPLLNGLNALPEEVFAEFGHNYFNRDHERHLIENLMRGKQRTGARLTSMPPDDYRRPRIQASHDMFALFLPLAERHGRAACYRLNTYFEGREMRKSE